VGSFAELPAGVAAQVDADAAEGDLILAYCQLLLDRPDLAGALGAQARAFVAAEHTLQAAALGYARFLSGLYGWPTLRMIRKTPLWEGETVPPPAPAEERFRESTALPETLPLVAAAGRGVAEIGLAEGDAGLLRAVAERIAEIQ
jgi:hypothetical protein